MGKINHFFHQLNHLLATKRLWQAVSFIALTAYLVPLVFYGENVNALVYDNLDSNVVWFKILAESGMIFAPNDAIIPNMMNGLPRLSYGSEFNVLLWLYYFFTPITAYVINEVLIHIVAFFSMLLLLDRYIVSQHTRYRHTVVYFTSLVFALQPFWPSAGLSIAALPLVTYLFANIYFHKAGKVEWLILALLPLYTSFILVYVFYLTFAGLFFIIDTVRQKKVNIDFLMALVLMSAAYLLSEYRLVISMLLGSDFVSHRTEFNVFFTEPFLDATRRFYLFFLDGHDTHVRGTQMPLILPFILFAIVLQLFRRRLTANESLVIIALFAGSIVLEVWNDALGSIYSIPSIVFFIIIYSIYTKKLNMLSASMLAVIFISALYGYTFFVGFDFIAEWFPIFKSFSLARAGFVQPLLWGVLISLSVMVVYRKLHFQVLFLVAILAAQLYISSIYSWHRVGHYKDSSSFQNYYAPALFKELKNDIPEKIEDVRFASFGLEPAVALYNGLYTVDGYSTNYPLAYKHSFGKVNEGYIGLNIDDTFEKWGSKLYIFSIQSTLGDYRRGIYINILNFDEKALRALGTEYLLSAYELTYPEDRHLTFVKEYRGGMDSWDIYLYRFDSNIE